MWNYSSLCHMSVCDPFFFSWCRMEKNSWELHERKMKEQYLLAISDKDQQLGHLQSLLRELRSSSQTQILPAQYQQQVRRSIHFY